MGLFARINRFSDVGSVIPTWSAINTLGRSWLISLTILVPFIGSLLLFNEQLVDLLSLIPELAGRFDKHDNPAGRTATLNRLYFTYFGLSFLGIGSFLFVLFCPGEIKEHASAVSFYNAEQPLITRSRLGLMVHDIAFHHDRYTNDGSEAGSWYQKAAFPVQVHRFMYEVFKDVFLEVIRNKPDWFDTESEGETTFTDHRGHPKIPGIVSILQYRGLGMDSGVRDLFLEAAYNNIVDFTTLRYMTLNYSRPFLRIMVSLCYIFGFTILFSPLCRHQF